LHPHYDTSLVEWSRAFGKEMIPSGGKEAVRQSPERYLKAVHG
jgi:hypothetical protein